MVGELIEVEVSQEVMGEASVEVLAIPMLVEPELVWEQEPLAAPAQRHPEGLQLAVVLVVPTLVPLAQTSTAASLVRGSPVQACPVLELVKELAEELLDHENKEKI